jgi:hypothetical protein
MAPDGIVPDMWPPMPIDPPPRAMAGPATDPATRQAIAATTTGIDLFMVSPFSVRRETLSRATEDVWIDSQRRLRPFAATGQADG